MPLTNAQLDHLVELCRQFISTDIASAISIYRIIQSQETAKSRIGFWSWRVGGQLFASHSDREFAVKGMLETCEQMMKTIDAQRTRAKELHAQVSQELEWLVAFATAHGFPQHVITAHHMRYTLAIHARISPDDVFCAASALLDAGPPDSSSVLVAALAQLRLFGPAATTHVARWFKLLVTRMVPGPNWPAIAALGETIATDMCMPLVIRDPEVVWVIQQVSKAMLRVGKGNEADQLLNRAIRALGVDGSSAVPAVYFLLVFERIIALKQLSRTGQALSDALLALSFAVRVRAASEANDLCAEVLLMSNEQNAVRTVEEIALLANVMSTISDADEPEMWQEYADVLLKTKRAEECATALSVFCRLANNTYTDTEKQIAYTLRAARECQKAGYMSDAEYFFAALYAKLPHTSPVWLEIRAFEEQQHKPATTLPEEAKPPAAAAASSATAPEPKKDVGAPTPMATDARARECVICMDAERTHLFNPCGHLAACAACAVTVTSCPICRAVINSVVQVRIP